MGLMRRITASAFRCFLVHSEHSLTDFSIPRYSVSVRRINRDHGGYKMREVLDLIGASKYLSVSVATLRAWKRQGRGPTYFRAGKLVRYRRVDLDAWIQRHSVSHMEA